MSNCAVFTIPGNEVLGNSLIKLLQAEPGEVIICHFPDGGTYVKVISNVYEKEAIIVCSLYQPNEKILPLYFLAKTLKELRAATVTLVVPYLAYMQQDKRFTDGECRGSEMFPKLLSSFIDKVITIDPYLHRNAMPDEVYPTHTSVLNASPLISKWISENMYQPLLIGLDDKSEKWISKLAAHANVAYVIPEKNINDDGDAKVLITQVEKYPEHIPVLVDDIITAGNSMIEATLYLKMAGMKPPVCIGIHAVFDEILYKNLLEAGIDKVVTTNTIAHPSNAIYIDGLLADEICKTSFIV